jgi:NADH-quinone oxidoreductase subunit H
MVFMFLLVTWIRWSFVRIRADQILALSWKALLPATLALLLTTAVVVVWRTTNGF